MNTPQPLLWSIILSLFLCFGPAQAETPRNPAASIYSGQVKKAKKYSKKKRISKRKFEKKIKIKMFKSKEPRDMGVS